MAWKTILFRQILHEAHAVVLEDDLAFLLGGVQVHVSLDAEVAVGVLAQEDLAHMPEVLFGFGLSSMER